MQIKLCDHPAKCIYTLSLLITFPLIKQSTCSPQTGRLSLHQRYHIVEEVGHGCYSTVYKAIDPRTNELVAIKEIKIFDKYQGLPQAFYREVAQLRQLDDENIIKLKEIFVADDGKTYLVLEYCNYDLDNLIKSAKIKKNGNGALSPILVKSYFKQLLSAILTCHKNGIIHRDLKPSNVLINQNNVVKLADFGLSRNFSTSSANKTFNVVTPGYKAPEIILGDPNYGLASDIWSLGVILFEMITGKQLFNPATYNDMSQLMAIVNILGKPEESDFPNNSTLLNYNILRTPFFDMYKENHLDALLRLSLVGEFEEAISLIEGMLCYNPEERISIQEALNHPFLYDEADSINPSKLPLISFEENHGIEFVESPSSFSSAETSPIRPLRVELVPIMA